jgi:hypothetical protein
VSHNPNRLLVEGQDDLFSVVGLIRHFVNWPQGKPKSKSDYPVLIEAIGGVEEILEQNFIPTLIKDPTIKTLGVVFDADNDPASRYLSFRNLCVPHFPKIPKQLSSDGLIEENDDGRRIGLWIMPDNLSKGAIELFIKELVPDTGIPSWQHAVKSVTEARNKGATYKDCHVDKANLYSWLAWQDEPGQYPGHALTTKILEPKAPSAATFVKWFLKLYSLEPAINLQG